MNVNSQNEFVFEINKQKQTQMSPYVKMMNVLEINKQTQTAFFQSRLQDEHPRTRVYVYPIWTGSSIMDKF